MNLLPYYCGSCGREIAVKWMLTRLYSYVCAHHATTQICMYSSTHWNNSGYTCDCYFLWFTCSSEHFAKVQFGTISLTFVKATGQSNKLLRLCDSFGVLLTVSGCWWCWVRYWILIGLWETFLLAWGDKSVSRSSKTLICSLISLDSS